MICDRQTLQTDFDNHTIINESRVSTGGLFNYANTSFPSNYTPIETSVRLVNYYDNYSWQTDALFNFDGSKAFGTRWTESGAALGMATGSLERNVKTNTWQKMVFYYDFKSRIIQDFHLTNLNNIVRKDHQYRFNGELLKLRIDKKNSSNVVLSTKILTYQYDHLGRKVGYVYNGKPIVKYLYDAIGRLQTKKFSPSGTTQGSKQTGNWTDASSWLSGTLPTLADNVTISTGQTLTIPSGEKGFAGTLNDKGTLKNFGTLNLGKATTVDLYTQTLSYHIRGGMKGINLDASGNLTNTLFSYKLEYEDDGTYFDGNIRKQTWRSNIDNVTRSNTFRYDGSSQLKAATFTSTKTGENYGLNNVNYDFNGNILALSRSGATNANFTSFGNVDNLVYTYQSNSNKLLKIADATTTNADLGDFRDGTNTDNDYEYWADGSLKRDKNKKIALTYNYLKLPEIITFDNGRTITTEYSASGTKLKKIDSNGETTDYEEDDIYVNSVLYQTSHDEGRINAKGEYEYNITDHNNDLRVAFRDSLGIAVPTQSIFYDPWGLSMKGMQITRNPLNFNRFQFLNRELQIETGLVDLINRQYNPQTGQFTSQDPITDGQEHLSLYQYGWNNPVLRPDPNGDCPTCPPYTNPMQPVWEGFGQMFQAGASMIDRISVATTSLVERTFTLNGTSTTTSNLTSTDTHTNLSASFLYIKNNNSNEVNPNSFFTTTVKNETSASTKKEVDLGVGKGSIKNSVTTDGKVTIETKADIQASKAWKVGATTSVSTNGDKKFKVEGTTGVSKGKAGVFTQFTNSVKSFAAEIGVSFETESKNKNIKTKNTASIKYTQDKP